MTIIITYNPIPWPYYYNYYNVMLCDEHRVHTTRGCFLKNQVTEGLGIPDSLQTNSPISPFTMSTSSNRDSNLGFLFLSTK